MNIILEDLRTQREGPLALGFWALLVYRFGHARFVIRNRWLRLPWTIVYVVLNKLVEVLCGISIPATARLGRRVCIEHHGGIVLHGAVELGDDCLLRHGVTIGNSGAADPMAAPRIGHHVEIGAGAKLLGRIVIGDYAIIGANAVVVKDVADHAVVGGVPARVIGRRD